MLDVTLLRAISEALQAEAGDYVNGSDGWAVFQDAADALADAADHREAEERG